MKWDIIIFFKGNMNWVLKNDEKYWQTSGGVSVVLVRKLSYRKFLSSYSELSPVCKSFFSKSQIIWIFLLVQF